MATAESTPASLGPRYAPEDPTLPKPWKGLIDGSTGLLYYWNPDTNVTQYERPAALVPPLPSGPPPASTTPKLAPIPVARTHQPNGMIAQQGLQMAQQLGQQLPQQQGVPMPQQQGQQMQPQQQQVQQMPHQQQGSQMAYQQLGQQWPHQQQGQQLPQQQQGQQLPLTQGQQLTQTQGQQLPQTQGQQLPNQPQGQQMPQQQMPQQQMPQQQGQQLMHHLGQHFSYQQLQQISYPQGQQISHTQSPQIPEQQAQHNMHQQGQQIPHQQVQQFGFPQREDTSFQPGKQTGFSSSQIPQTGFSSAHNLPAGNHSVQASQMSFHSINSQQATSSSINAPPTSGSLVPTKQTGVDSIHHKQIGGPMVPSQTGPSVIRSQQAGGPPMGLKTGYEEAQPGRAGNDFYFSSSREKGMVIPQQPKLAALPLPHNPQEMRMGTVHPQSVPPGPMSGLNIAAGRPMSNMYNHSAGGQTFTNNAPMRPSPRMLGSSDLPNLSAAEAYRQTHEVSASGENVPAPFMTFEATGFPPEILREIQMAGFSSPTPIQAQTWPIALQSRDIVAIAKTGSGKTLGYLLPAFIHLRRSQNNSQAGPTVLVLAPTRELATQIQDEAIKFGRSSRVSCTCLYGGAPKGPQLREIERGADIVVATPGRLNDILEMKKINFRQVSFLVLDEADRMLDMGFEPQIRKIVNEIPPRRQTLMYTATWPKEVRKIAGDLLMNPVQVNIGSVDELEANKSITQYVEVVPQMEKQKRLEQILRSQERGSKVIIFCSTKRLCDQLARSIGRFFGAAAIHGDKTQDERDWVLNQFRSGKSPILVATDVAARGLDIKDIRVVINYDFPTGIEDYVHRIGRTGRAGATGVSYTFFSDQDWKYAADLVKVLEGANQRVPPEVREIATRGSSGFNRSRGGISRWDSGGGRRDSGGRGGRDSGFGSRGGRDSGFGARGGRDGGFGGRGGRNDFFGGRGNRGRGFGGPGGRGRHDRPHHDRYDSMNGRGRYDQRRGIGDRSRGRSYSRSYSPSPDRVRTWDYNRSDSRSRSRSRSWSPSRSRSRSHSRSRSRSYDRYERQQHGPDHVQNPPSDYGVPPASRMSPMSPGPNPGSLPRNEPPPLEQLPVAENPIRGGDEPGAELSPHPVADV